MENYIRTPLKDINSEKSISPTPKKECTKLKMKRKRKKSLKRSSNDLDTQGNLSNFISFGNSSTQMLVNNEKVEENVDSQLNDDHNDSLKYTMYRVNRFFMEDLKCPEFSPFSQISYSCSTASGCERENHKIIAEQISETQEKALTFLAKSWYALKYPLTCLINERTYLSPFVLRFLFYGIVDEKDENTCLRIKDIIKGHLNLHPPCSRRLRNLYCSALVGEIDNVDPSNPEIVTYNFKNILKSIGDTIKDINNKPDNEDVLEEKFDGNKSIEIPENIDDFYQFFSDNYTKTGNILPPNLISSNKDFEEDKDKINSEALLKRLFFVFTLMVDILEENFRMWWMRSRYCLRNKLRSETSFPIIVKIAWEDVKDRNSLNQHCIEVFDLFRSCPKEYKLEIARYITLLSEVVRASEENKEMKFPSFGIHCNRFAEELSYYIKVENIINEETLTNIQLIYPYWLRFKVIGYILKSELTSSGIDDLNSIVKLIKRNLSLKPKAVLNRSNQKGTKKNLNVKNNKCDTSGETVVHKYCRMNNHKGLSAALRNKEVNVNIADNAGWTPLHNAAYYNSIDCLKLLIKHRLSAPSGAEELNIFALNSDNDTALSCAVKQENDEIVDIFLSSGAGVTIWNTVSSGCSSVQLAKTKQMEEALIKGWETSTALYRNLNLTSLEIQLLYHMIISYCKLYHVREFSVSLDPKTCKPDSYYNFDYIQYCKDENSLVTLYELVEKLSTCRSNPKNLKMILFYLKCKIN